MLRLGLGAPLERVLVLGAHADDAEIGCGGTVLTLLGRRPALEIAWVVLAATGRRADEARASAVALVGREPQVLEVHGFRDGYLPAERAAVKDVVEDLARRFDPQLVLTHSRDESHQDHRLVAELTWNAFRDHAILEYEIPKWDGDLVRRNVYVELADDVVERKLELLARHFPSQADKHWFDEETFRGLMRLRGVECGARYAEAFAAPKLVLDAAG